jgi:hypothetical protein
MARVLSILLLALAPLACASGSDKGLDGAYDYVAQNGYHATLEITGDEFQLCDPECSTGVIVRVENHPEHIVLKGAGIAAFYNKVSDDLRRHNPQTPKSNGNVDASVEYGIAGPAIYIGPMPDDFFRRR